MMSYPGNESVSQPSRAPRGERLLTIRSGGYVLIIAALLSILLIVWALMPAVTSLFNRPPGDGENPESYGFALQPSLIPLDELTTPLLYRDLVPVMDEPTYVEGASLAPAVTAEQRRKLLVPRDRVIGVLIDGESRAYPVSVLTVHEVVHDTLGGVPIAVTYHWPSDGAVVFDRRIDGEVAHFGISGLMWNGTQVLYRRHAVEVPVDDMGGESLYSQLQARAITGPDAEAGVTLNTLSFEMTSWGQWYAAHPETSVVTQDPHLRRKRYEQGDPGAYRTNEDLPHGAPVPPAGSINRKDRVVAVELDDRWHVFAEPVIAELVDTHSLWVCTIEGRSLAVRWDKPSRSLSVVERDAGGTWRPLPMRHAYWFAWHALYGDSLIHPAPEASPES